MRLSLTFVMAVLMVLLVAAAAFSGEIHRAIADGDVARVKDLLGQDPALANVPDETDRFSSLPLHLAAQGGHLEIVKALLATGVDVDCGDSDESTPLHVAAMRRHQDVVTLLLKHGADVNKRDRNGAYALSFAASGGDENIVKQILDAGADLNYINRQGVSLLHFAGARGLTDLFDLLIERGHDVNAASEAGRTPLHSAAGSGNADMVRRMLAAGADPSAVEEGESTPLIDAAWNGHVEVGRLLLDAGASLDHAQNGGWTAMHLAIRTKKLDFVRLLLEHGADVDLANDGGRTPLILAVMAGDPDILEALLEAGADTEIAESHFGRTALHLASIRGYRDLAERLVTSGASLSSKDGRGNTPIEFAATYGHGDVVEVLSAGGGDASGLEATDGTLAAQGNLAQGEAVIWYLGHSGWAIKTSEHLLVFDYADRDRLPSQPGLCNGRIEPSELAGEEVTVFATHEHGDHLDPRIYEWHGRIPDLTYIFGCRPDSAPPYEYMEGRQKQVINGMEITTITSNDTGVGFVVNVDGLVIYHAGDHANRQRDFSGPYKAEIEFLASEGVKPDIAFMPISGCGFGDQEAVKMGVHYTLATLHPSIFMPMHAGGGEFRYHEFIAECKDDFPKMQMKAPVDRGDHFRYRDGRIS